jgi:hypothetical protein
MVQVASWPSARVTDVSVEDAPVHTQSEAV